jgi:hypothetical protein
MAIHADLRTHTAAVPSSGAGHERRFDPHTELSEFLRTRRTRLKPADVGLAGRPEPASASEEALRLLASWGADASQDWSATMRSRV